MNGRLARALGNEHYRGRAFAWLFLLAIGAMDLFRGSVHLFRHDGVAAIDLAVALRFRALVPPPTGYHALNQLGVALDPWWWRPLPLEAPGRYGAVAILPIAFWAATRRTGSTADALPLAERAS